MQAACAATVTLDLGTQYEGASLKDVIQFLSAVKRNSILDKLIKITTKIARHQSVKTKLEAELQKKNKAVENVRLSIVNRLKNEIIPMDKDLYISNGVKNWRLLRKHLFLLESYCKKNLNGKIPP